MASRTVHAAPALLAALCLSALALQPCTAAQAAPVHAAAAAATDTPDEGDDGADELPDDPNRVLPTQQDIQSRYAISAEEALLPAFVEPKLPDLSAYTTARLEAKIDRSTKGSVRIGSLLYEPGFKSLTTTFGQGLAEVAKRQRGGLRAIFVENGTVSLPALAAALPKDLFDQPSPGVYILRLPLLVRHGATLVISQGVRELRLSQDRGTMLAVEGNLFIVRSKLVGWNEAKNAPSRFRDKHEFRPFVVAWGGSRTYIADSVIESLGYASTKGFGLTLAQYSPSLAQRAVWARPTGWVIGTEITDLWYGFYCSEADDVVLRGNTLRNNIKYGIDPHDHSRRLVIAENVAHGTRLKHGIIISRDVNDSFIVGNKSYENKLSGIVLDRQCTNNVIANNLTYRNESDGIVLSESPRNVLWNNLSSGNVHHGIRLRNSTDIRIENNSAIANGLAGIYAVARDLSGSGRNLVQDPYRKAVSMTVSGGQFTSNGSGPINLDEPTRVALYNLDLRTPQRQLGYRLGGVLLAFQIEVLDILINRKQAVVLQPRAAAAAAASLPSAASQAAP